MAALEYLTLTPMNDILDCANTRLMAKAGGHNAPLQRRPSRISSAVINVWIVIVEGCGRISV
jgi:hypothetical protein